MQTILIIKHLKPAFVESILSAQDFSRSLTNVTPDQESLSEKLDKSEETQGPIPIR